MGDGAPGIGSTGSIGVVSGMIVGGGGGCCGETGAGRSGVFGVWVGVSGVTS
jgi:hypothetical protein